MASKFSAFMAQNVEKIENKKIVVSNRFKDEDGKPIEWEIRAIMEDENEELQRKCFVTTPIVGQRSSYNRELDQVKYVAALMSASVVFPDLNNAELQDSYGVKTPEALLKKMLLPAEMGVLASAVTEFSKLNEEEKLIEEAKN